MDSDEMKQAIRRIETDSKVAIIGGGPAGCFFALYLMKYAKEREISPEIIIYEPRRLDDPGMQGCKGCAGILSPSLVDNLTELDLILPQEIIQRKIEHYTIHSPYTSITLSKQERDTQILSIYRGGGPRISCGISTAGFDGWLLRQAEERGARVIRDRVSAIFAGQEAGIEVIGRKVAFDLVVLATGVNAALVKVFGLEYIPPKTLIMAQEEIYADAGEIESRFSDTAHAFLLPHSGIIFGTLVPKGSFINISVLSRRKHPVSVKEFLQYDLVRQLLPERYEHTCGCWPKAAVSSASNFYADRFVAVGDAAVVRLYKDGIGSSQRMAREAARTAV